MNEKVSVIVPIYNASKYLCMCIDSIINQTYKNIEIILVNDGSTDESGKILDEYSNKDSRIKVFHKENTGVSSTRNFGIDKATGDYICFSDADDYLMEDYVEYLLNLIKKNNSDVALTKDMFTTFHPEQNKNDKIELYSNEEATRDILIYNVPIGVYCKIFKRDFLLKNNIRFEEDLFIGEGFNFNTDCFQRANSVGIGYKKIYFYRRDNSESATTKFSMKKWDNGLYAIEKINKKMTLKSKKISKAIKYARWHTNQDTFNFMVIAKAEKENYEKYKKIKKIVRTQAYHAYFLPISFKEKIRATICIFCPRLIPFLIYKRNKHYMDK